MDYIRISFPYMSPRSYRILFIIQLINFTSGVLTLKNVHVKIPKAIVGGQDAILYCFFDLEGANLYSVKWYKKTSEFFRYVPMATPPTRSFKIKGIHVLEEKCNVTQIVLYNVGKEAIGEYSCEVSADQPHFSTGMKSFTLQVVDLPTSDPHIDGLRSRYRLGELIDINCTSFGSDPAVNLTWYINGIPSYFTNTNFNNRLTHSNLKFNLASDHVINDKLKIRCSASMFDVYHKSSEKSVELKKEKNNKFNYEVDINTVDPKFQWELAETAQRSLDSSLIHRKAVNAVSATFKLNFNTIFLLFLLLFFI